MVSIIVQLVLSLVSGLFGALIGAIIAVWGAYRLEEKKRANEENIRHGIEVYTPFLKDISNKIDTLNGIGPFPLKTDLWDDKKNSYLYFTCPVDVIIVISSFFNNVRGYNNFLRNEIGDVKSIICNKIYNRCESASVLGSEKSSKLFKEKMIQSIDSSIYEIFQDLIRKKNFNIAIDYKWAEDMQNRIINNYEQCHEKNPIAIGIVKSIIKKQTEVALNEIIESKSFISFLGARKKLIDEGALLYKIIVGQIKNH